MSNRVREGVLGMSDGIGWQVSAYELSHDCP